MRIAGKVITPEKMPQPSPKWLPTRIITMIEGAVQIAGTSIMGIKAIRHIPINVAKKYTAFFIKVILRVRLHIK